MHADTAPPSYVVIGTSAGGVPALSKIFKTLPPDFPGAILVVMHLPNKASASRVAERLVGIGSTPVREAKDGEQARQRTAYIAPAGQHMLLEGNRIRGGAGPPEHKGDGSRVLGALDEGSTHDGARRTACDLPRGALPVKSSCSAREVEWRS